MGKFVPIKSMLASTGMSLAVIGLDLGTKNWAESYLAAASIQIIPGLLELHLAHNRGVAWSLLSDLGDFGRFGLVLFAIAACMFICWLLLTRDGRLERVGLALILGGAIGNAIDRASRGHVVDFIHAYWREYHFPIFNVADVAITVGAGALIFSEFVAHRNRPR